MAPILNEAARLRLEHIGILLVQMHRAVYASRKSPEVRLELVAGLLEQVADKLMVKLPEVN